MKSKKVCLPFRMKQKQADASFFEKTETVTENYRYTLSDTENSSWKAFPLCKPVDFLTLKETGMIAFFQVFAAVLIALSCLFFLPFNLAYKIGEICLIIGFISFPFIYYYIKNSLYKNTYQGWYKKRAKKSFFVTTFGEDKSLELLSFNSEQFSVSEDSYVEDMSVYWKNEKIELGKKEEKLKAISKMV